jgi:hypothetical protein
MQAIFILQILVAPFGLQAQHDQIRARYIMNPLMVNPSYQGIGNNIQANTGYVMQWMLKKILLKFVGI